jgi:hypothetical protein
MVVENVPAAGGLAKGPPSFAGPLEAPCPDVPYMVRPQRPVERTHNDLDHNSEPHNSQPTQFPILDIFLDMNSGHDRPTAANGSE